MVFMFSISKIWSLLQSYGPKRAVWRDLIFVEEFLFSFRYSYIVEGFVRCCVVWNLNGNNFYLVNIYSSCYLNEKRKLLANLVMSR